MELEELTRYLDGLLSVSTFPDYCPNGLQVEGRSEVHKVITGVSACTELFDAAIRENGDAIIVHHGLFWDGQPSVITRSRKKRIERLVKNDISLLAYHLPLDAHPLYGNNAQIAGKLGLVNRRLFGKAKGNMIGCIGELPEPLSSEEVFTHLRNQLNAPITVHPFGPDTIQKIGVCSGGAQSYFPEAVDDGVDLFLTGEQSEWVFHYAKEEGVHYVAAGHHATERFGVQALATHLKGHFHIETLFIDIENPI